MLNTTGGFAGLVSSIIGIFNILIPVLCALALVLFMIGAVRYVYSQGAQKNTNEILWSVIALFVLFSIWGILRILTNTFLVGVSNDGGSYNASGSSYPQEVHQGF